VPPEGVAESFFTITRSMRLQHYTFFLASNASGGIRRVPFYVLLLLTTLAIIGGGMIASGLASYSRMLYKATNHNSLPRRLASSE